MSGWPRSLTDSKFNRLAVVMRPSYQPGWLSASCKALSHPSGGADSTGGSGRGISGMGGSAGRGHVHLRAFVRDEGVIVLGRHVKRRQANGRGHIHHACVCLPVGRRYRKLSSSGWTSALPPPQPSPKEVKTWKLSLLCSRPKSVDMTATRVDLRARPARARYSGSLAGGRGLAYAPSSAFPSSSLDPAVDRILIMLDV
jgi:hypothetical protein